MALPAVAMAWMLLLLADPDTQPGARWILEENHPIEVLTFVFLLAGGVLGLLLARRARRLALPTAVSGFYLVFALGLLVAGMEEIAWGQQFLGFETPAVIGHLNRQHETTLHNMPGMHGRTELLRIAFGLGGLIGVFACPRRLARLAAPHVLWPWFAVILIHASGDYYGDFRHFNRGVDFAVKRTSELVELLIGVAGFLYVLFQRAELERDARAQGQLPHLSMPRPSACARGRARG
jgi:hypothetical protein